VVREDDVFPVEGVPDYLREMYTRMKLREMNERFEARLNKLESAFDSHASTVKESFIASQEKWEAL
jgi:hypothetical protein